MGPTRAWKSPKFDPVGRSKLRPARPVARPPIVPERPGFFAELYGTFEPFSWPGGARADAAAETPAAAAATLRGFVSFMRALKGWRSCAAIVAKQSFIASYPSLSAVWMGIVFDQATRSSATQFLRRHGKGRAYRRIATLLFTGYFGLYLFNLWCRWTYWASAGLGGCRERFRSALLLKLLRFPEAARPPPGEAMASLEARVEDVISFWHTCHKLSGIPMALLVQLAIITGSSTTTVRSSSVVVGPLLICGSMALVMRRHSKALVATARERVAAHQHLFSAAFDQVAKGRGGEEVRDARADAETFAVANFVYRRRHALRFLTALEAAMESGVLSRLWLCALFMTAGWAVLDDEMTPGEFFVVYNVLTEVDKTVARIARAIADVPGAHASIVVLATVFNHGHKRDPPDGDRHGGFFARFVGTAAAAKRAAPSPRKLLARPTAHDSET